MRKSVDENISYAPFRLINLLRKQHIDIIEKPRFRIKYSNNFERLAFITKNCHRLCKQDCNYSYFIYDINKINNYANADPTFKFSLVTLQDNRLPDLFVRHIPETTFVAFVGNFGGLLGMWLRLSSLMIFDIAYKIIEQIIISFGKSDKQENILIVQSNKYSINLRNKFTQINNFN